MHDPLLLSAHKAKYHNLPDIIRTKLDLTPGIEGALNLFEELHDQTAII